MQISNSKANRARLLAMTAIAGSAALFAVSPVGAAEAAAQQSDKQDKGKGKEEPVDPGPLAAPPGSGGGGLPCGPETYNAPPPSPPEKYAKSPGDVDMRTGRLIYSSTDLAIGGDEDGISFGREPYPIRYTSTLPSGPGEFGGLTHNWRISLTERRVAWCGANYPSEYKYRVSVNYPGQSSTFESLSGFVQYPDDFLLQGGGSYGRLDPGFTSGGNPLNYTFYTADGTKISFRSISNNDGCGAYNEKCVFASEILKANGTKYTLTYDTAGPPNLRSINSNRGYSVVLEYSGLGVGGKQVVTKACAVNLAQNYINPASTSPTCPSGVATATYSYTSGKLSSYVDQGGISTLIGPDLTKLYFPGETTPYVTNSMGTSTTATYVNSQTFADGRTFSYAWTWDGNTPHGGIMGGTYTDNESNTVSVVYGKYRNPNFGSSDPTWYVTPGPETVIDELGRSTTATYCTNINGTQCKLNPPLTITSPEGNKRNFTYSSNQVTQVQHVSKPGSGDGTRTESTIYGAGCAYNSACFKKPTSVTDAMGNTTNFTYDTAHGGLLTEMQPAPAANAARPLKVNTWVQKSAYIKNSGGTLVAASPQVWVLDTETVCETATGANPAATCASGTTHTVTSYEYGANGTADNLLVQKVKVTAGTEKRCTTFTYDDRGRVIAESQPLANTGSCS